MYRKILLSERKELIKEENLPARRLLKDFTNKIERLYLMIP
jgi:hypothetical protein